MSAFKVGMKRDQIAWRQAHDQEIDQTPGLYRGKQYPHLLPRSKWEQNLWPGIRSGSASDLPAYLLRDRIKRHTQSHNLLSSWVVCANLYFPFRNSPDGRELLAGFLRTTVAPEVSEVHGVELEFELAGDLHPSALLGEQRGQRGASQTSPDVAFLVRTEEGGSGLILTESKFTETSFYGCSAYTKKTSTGRPPNPDRRRCLDAKAVLASPRQQCHQVAWGRRYWDHLGEAARERAFERLQCCPAAKAGYQLFRQQALAEGIAASGRYAPVVSCVAYDGKNDTLVRCLARTGIDNFTTGWGDLFRGKARFATFTHQQWVDWVRQNDRSRRWTDWGSYVAERYGYGCS